MRMRHAVIWLWLILLIVPAAVRAQSLASRMPSDTMIYLGWEGTDKLQPAYNQSHLKAILDATTIQDFLQNKLPELIDRLGQQGNPDDAAAIKQGLEVATTMCKYPTALLYVGSVEMKQDTPPMPRIALVCDAGDKAADMEKTLAGFIEKAGAPVPLAVKRNGATVMLTIGVLGDSAEAILLGKDTTRAATLAGDKAFNDAMGQVQKNAR